jgi:predicted nucleic acid-binding Zn ribbon protein
MRVFNDYECDQCGCIEEHFLENGTRSCTCLQCGGTARKVLSVPHFQLPGNDPAGFPTAADKWVKKREQKMAQERRQGHKSFGE